jgi:hypothetical protein
MKRQIDLRKDFDEYEKTFFAQLATTFAEAQNLHGVLRKLKEEQSFRSPRTGARARI